MIISPWVLPQDSSTEAKQFDLENQVVNVRAEINDAEEAVHIRLYTLIVLDG